MNTRRSKIQRGLLVLAEKPKKVNKPKAEPKAKDKGIMPEVETVMPVVTEGGKEKE